MYKKLYGIIVATLSVSAPLCAVGAGGLDATFNSLGFTRGVEYIPMTRFMNDVTGDRSTLVLPNGKVLVLGSLCGVLSVARLNSTGSVDGTFGSSGIASNYIRDITSSQTYALAVQSDGKILVAGYSEVTGNYSLIVARFNADGSIDTGFGFEGSGVAFVAIETATFASAYSVAVQPDGKIVIAGSAVTAGSSSIVLSRLNTDGSLDEGFGDGGIHYEGIGATTYAYSMVIQPADSKIVVAGYTVDGVDTFFVARFNADGVSLDASFGDGSGIAELSIGDASRGHSVVLQADGKIVACGYTTIGVDQFVIVRLDTDGVLDTSFGDNSSGIKMVVIGNAAQANSVTVQPLIGRIIVGGVADAHYAVVRLNSDGSRDLSFGNNGITTLEVGSLDSQACSVALQSDGKVVVGGFSSVYNDVVVGSGVGINAILRLLGEQEEPFDIAYSVLVQSDGKIVIAGYTFNGIIGQCGVARLGIKGGFDTTFNGTGMQTIGTGTDSGAQAVALQSNGKIVLGGYAVIDNVSQFLVARLTASGAWDSSFGTFGVVTVPVGSSAFGRALGIQEDDKIVVAGYTVVDGIHKCAVIRLTATGVLDNSFGVGGIVILDSLTRAMELDEDETIVAAGYMRHGSESLTVQPTPRMSFSSWLQSAYAD